ncbi:MAG: LOG family protein [Gammaproteobacteria bacterium]|nr:LOG family protein [Gammaproteobacteria bacterium]MBU2678415.1 LOG family protein [Gammaproteobacteria bacterium]NNC57959.1 LOG family protein [Woeseiaceae bacterium]NNL52150.1 LOG family protein [Woeseiaceae bacterium]
MQTAVQFVDAEVWPEGSLEVLSRFEVDQLKNGGAGGLYPLLRRCMLAVLHSDSQTDDTRKVLEAYKDFEVGFIQQDRGLKVSLTNAPAEAFVDGKMIRGTRELLFAVLRDIVFTRNDIMESGQFDLRTSAGITNAVFHIVRNARLLKVPAEVNLVVCWGGHAISRSEYDYSKQVGYELGLRALNVCTGCGPGAMKGPMKGATIAHAKQRIRGGRYIGVTEPGIIAAESPNPIVNSLVIMPDMEKRLEAFVRVGHGIVVFPGGVGTAEEILYLLGVLLHPENQGQPMPFIMTGPASAEPYFRQIDEFVAATLGDEARSCYEIIIDDPRRVARQMNERLDDVLTFRRTHGDAYFFNWRLQIEEAFQNPFVATHESMRNLDLNEDLPKHVLAANLRRVFSGIVSGNVREDTAELIERDGPFEIDGSRRLMNLLDDLLNGFVAKRRMKISTGEYHPCYVIK